MTRDELARAIVKLPGWRWMPGMLDVYGERVSEVTLDEVVVDAACPSGVGLESRRLSDMRPTDLTDAATGGCLLALLGESIRHVRQVSGHRALRGRLRTTHGRVCCDGWIIEYVTGAVGMPKADGATLGEACARVALALGRWPGGGS